MADPISDDQIYERWRKLVEETEAMSERAQADESFAAMQGIQPVLPNGGRPEVIGYRSFGHAPVNMKAAWLRGAAKRLIPPEFDYSVQEMIGGEAGLVLLKFDADVNRDPLVDLLRSR